jgi:peptide deformylase
VPPQTSTIAELRTGGAVLPIVRWGNPILHRHTRPVTAFDDELRELLRNMFATMYAAEGVGLAATQVGVDPGGIRLRLPPMMTGYDMSA